MRNFKTHNMHGFEQLDVKKNVMVKRSMEGQNYEHNC